MLFGEEFLLEGRAGGAQVESSVAERYYLNGGGLVGKEQEDGFARLVTDANSFDLCAHTQTIGRQFEKTLKGAVLPLWIRIGWSIGHVSIIDGFHGPFFPRKIFSHAPDLKQSISDKVRDQYTVR